MAALVDKAQRKRDYNREYSRAYQRRLDPEKKRAAARAWYIANPDLVRAQTQLAAARLRADPERRARKKEYMREWLAKNPERRAGYARKRHLRAEYGLTPAQYQAMVDSQGGKCAICERSCKLHVDHRHSDGKVRGLLCGSCNRAIGQLGEDVGRLEKAIDYLRQSA